LRQRRIVRYVLKPPIAEAQVSRTQDGRIAIELHRARKSGATHLVLEEMGLLKKLAAIVAPPARHRVRTSANLPDADKQIIQMINKAKDKNDPSIQNLARPWRATCAISRSTSSITRSRQPGNDRSSEHGGGPVSPL
jgi:hypothetical protein